ncbi:MAG: HD-GYP domain-containing protein [Eubacteriales bacterium]
MNQSREKIILHDAIECLAAALEAKDTYTQGHSNRVADMSLALAQKLDIGGLELEHIHIAAHLHDIGKIGVPDYILNKKGRLQPDEWDQIKQHPVIGHQILSKSNELKEVAMIVLYHHERWDGKGYPKGLKEDEIPLGSRIIGICDAVDAMMSSRPYREALPIDKISSELVRCSGSQFDPYILAAVDIKALLKEISPMYSKNNNLFN